MTINHYYFMTYFYAPISLPLCMGC